METTQWIKDEAKRYTNDLVQHRIARDKRLREEEIQRDRRDRIAEEGHAEGVKLWTALQVVIKNDVAEFNSECGISVLRPKTLGDGTFEVHFGEPGSTSEKVFALSYDPGTTVLSLQLFGGEKYLPFSIDLDDNSKFGFTNGRSFHDSDEISQMILKHLLA